MLKLNADFVVLSACNTAAGDKPGAEALSGLACITDVNAADDRQFLETRMGSAEVLGAVRHRW
jgi:hypothetical protein